MKKILSNITLLIFGIVFFTAGFLSSPLIENKVFNIPPLISGICAGISIFIIVYFYNTYKKN